MSYKVRTIYTKPSADVSLHTPSAEYTALIDTFFNAGKITQKPVETIDELNFTYEIIFANEDAYNEYNSQVVVNENYNIRLEHCNTHSISHSVEVGV